MSLLQRNDQAYPEYGDIVKLVKEVKEVNLACQPTDRLSWRRKLLQPSLIAPLLHAIFLPPADAGDEESI
jgi:hypothetical protein